MANLTPVQNMIVAAYLSLCVKTQDWVLLSELRPLVDNFSREEQDAALLSLVLTGLAHVAPDSSRQRNRPDQIAAALRIAGENNHLLAIEEEFFKD